MSIISDIALRVSGFNAKLSHELCFYKGDSLTLTFLITHNMIQKVKGFDATTQIPVQFISSKMIIETPSLTLHVDDMNNNQDNRCVFRIPSDYTQEIGTYRLQIVLYSNADNEVVHLPEIKMQIEEPIAEVILSSVSNNLLLTMNDDFLTTAAGDKILYTSGSTDNDNKRITDLDEVVKANATDYLIIETNNSTNKISYENLIKDLTATSSVTEDITVTGVNIGGYKNGDVIAVGTSMQDVLKKLFTNEIYPTYKAPTLSLSSSIVVAEYDSIISPVFNYTFTQNDAGPMTSCSLSYDTVTLTPSGNTATVTDYNITKNTKFTLTLNYDEGPTKQTNLGNDYETGKITAGTLTKDVTIKISLPHFGFSLENDDITEYRNQTRNLNAQKGTQITVVTKPTDRYVYFMYPYSLGQAQKIRFDNINDDENISAFDCIVTQDNSLNGTGTNRFYLYKYSSPIPFGQECKFILTI